LTLTLRPDPPPPSRRQGAPDRGATPLMEHVRVTNLDLDRRGRMEVARKRLVTGALLFVCMSSSPSG
jgi:hypothetical protein